MRLPKPLGRVAAALALTAAFACANGTTPICDAGLECGPYTVLPESDATLGDAAEDAEDSVDAAEVTGDASSVDADAVAPADSSISDSGLDSSGDSGHDSSD
jgi:hypothetical protein